jgi:hypothetical protein|tara:strand:- start:1767 stop:2036 length:270 start_codon:yes stop_codon:yes gene_type:complete
MREVEVEFRIIDDSSMPPLVISYNEEDMPKVIINTHHKVWISLHRRTIAGIIESLQDKMDIILTSFLTEHRAFEKQDQEDIRAFEEREE